MQVFRLSLRFVLSPEIPIATAAACEAPPSQSYMPQELQDAALDRARRRPYIPVSAYAIPLRLPDFVFPRIIQPDLEDSMVACSSSVF